MKLRAVSLQVPEVKGHPNRVPFSGTLCVADVASNQAPMGARGHNVLLTEDAILAAMPSLLGMAVNASEGESHNSKSKIGIITDAHLLENRLNVEGFLYGADFSEIVSRLRAQDALGMSFELLEAQVEDMRAEVWKLVDFTFAGAAILPVKKAAFHASSFRVAGGGQGSR